MTEVPIGLGCRGTQASETKRPAGTRVHGGSLGDRAARRRQAGLWSGLAVAAHEVLVGVRQRLVEVADRPSARLRADQDPALEPAAVHAHGVVPAVVRLTVFALEVTVDGLAHRRLRRRKENVERDDGHYNDGGEGGPNPNVDRRQAGLVVVDDRIEDFRGGGLSAPLIRLGGRELGTDPVQRQAPGLSPSDHREHWDAGPFTAVRANHAVLEAKQYDRHKEEREPVTLADQQVLTDGSALQTFVDLGSQDAGQAPQTDKDQCPTLEFAQAPVKWPRSASPRLASRQS